MISSRCPNSWTSLAAVLTPTLRTPDVVAGVAGQRQDIDDVLGAHAELFVHLCFIDRYLSWDRSLPRRAGLSRARSLSARRQPTEPLFARPLSKCCDDIVGFVTGDLEHGDPASTRRWIRSNWGIRSSGGRRDWPCRGRRFYGERSSLWRRRRSQYGLGIRAEELSEHTRKADDGVGWHAGTAEGTNPAICSEDVATSVDRKYLSWVVMGPTLKKPAASRQ